jgi:hypothetical protein
VLIASWPAPALRLNQVLAEHMTNQSFRERFGLAASKQSLLSSGHGGHHDETNQWRDQAGREVTQP